MMIACDLDGTIASWGHDGHHVGDWIEGAQDALRTLLAEGHRIIIHTCRATWKDGGGWGAVAVFLASAGFLPNLVVSTTDQRQVWMHPLSFDELPAGVREAVERVPDDAPIIGIWSGTGKPIAEAYVDDRGVSFPGQWTPQLLEQIRALAA